MALLLDGRDARPLTHHSSDIRNRLAENYKIFGKIPGERLADERELYTTKWFDYRFVSPSAATELFEREYQKIFRRKWAAIFDVEQAEKKQGLRKGGTGAGGSELTSLWRARQVCDGLGLPYPFFIDKAMEAAAGRGARHLPRPNQLYHVWNCQRALLAWNEWIKDNLRPSELPQYRNEAFCGLRAQIDHQLWVVERIKARATRSYLIGKCCFIRRILPVELAIAEFGNERVDCARREVEDEEPVSHTAIGGPDLWPSCMGLPHAHTEGIEPCATCPKEESCRVVSERLVAKLIEKHGSDDPVAAHKRALGAARVRKHRDRKANGRKPAA